MFFERARGAHPCEKEERGRRTVRGIIFDEGYLISDLMQKRISRVDIPFLAWRRVCSVECFQGCKSLAEVWWIVWFIWIYGVSDMDAFSYCVFGEEERRGGFFPLG